MKVLIVNTILIGDDNATGITLENMLYNISNIEFLQYCVDYRINNHVQLVDTTFMDLKDTLIDQIVAQFKSKKADEKEKNPVSQVKNESRLGDFLHGIVDCWPTRISKKNQECIVKFNPDLIYTMGGGIRVMNQAIKIARKLNRPLIFHCMDDWRSTIYKSFSTSEIFHIIAMNRLNHLHKYTTRNLAICEKMANFYSYEYKKKYSYASNCVFEFANSEYTSVGKEMNIVFSGGLHFGRGELLCEVGKLIDDLNIQGYEMNLKVFAPYCQIENYNEQFEVLKYSKLLPYVERKEQLNNLMKADILLHVESFDQGAFQHMQYSFSTKLAEYFAAGRAILGYGSKRLSSIEYIEKHRCGYIAENEEELRDKLIEVYSDVENRCKCAKNSLSIAKLNHSQDKIQQRIKAVFESVIRDESIVDE